LVEFAKDPNILYNRVSEKVFQFRLQYWYDDNEGSDLALGSISTIPINNMLCGSGVNDAYNCIQLTIPDTSLVTPSSMSIIKQVRILVREGNEGIWRIVENLDYCQWVDLVDGNITATYTFYNDIATTAIDDATVNKPYDDVPLECGDGLVIKNRAVLSNVTKGYDTPDCLEVVVEQDFQDNPQQEGYTISGLVRIFSEYLEFTAPLNPAFTQTPFEIPSTYKLRGGIYHDTSRTNEDAGGNFPFFGGGGYGSGTSDFNIRAGMETDFDQRIPEGGFPVYLAGTDFLSISRQIDVGLVTDQIGALDTSQSSFKTSIGDYLQPSLNNDLFSGFEIKNVPAGKYVIRLASHWCSFGNKLDKGGAYDLLKGRGYQRTSTNVWAVNVYDESTGTYTWTNASNSVVGNSSVAVNLPAGIYSVSIAGAGNALCGTASATVAVGVGTPQTQYLYKPYCGAQAYLNTTGGTNFQWYLGNAPIQGSLGTASGYTVNNPSPGQVYNLSYTNLQNCLSQISYTLMSSSPGAVSVSATSVCVNGTNGTGTINLTPAPGAPPGVNSYSVVNAIGTPPYNFSVYPTALNVYTISGLAAGVYSVETFDGSCKYFNLMYVNTYINNPTITPVSMTPCTQPFAASITWSVPPQPGQFTFNWQPNQYILGNLNTSQNVLIQPNVPPGTNTVITYTCLITPSAINCPITRTMSINMINPATPTFVPIPNLCTNSNSYSIQVNPTGGTFSIPNGVIVPTSTALAIGTNTFTYSYSQNGCGSSNSGTFQLNQFNPATLTSTIAPLCVTGNTVNLMNIVQSTVGVWSGTNVVNGIFNPAFLPTNNYVFTYSTQSNPNPTVCPAFSNLTISVTNTLLPSIVVNPEFCTNGSTFQVVASPNGGIWANPTLSQNGIVTPSLATLQNTLASYTVNVGPCVNTNTFALRPSIFRSAALTGTIGHLCVNNSAVNLMNIVQNTVGVWTGINVNNIWFNPAGLPTNTYVLTYSTQSIPNTSLCPDSKTITVQVSNPPVPNISNVGPFCSKDGAVQLTVTPNIGNWVSSSFVSSTGVFNPQTAAIGNNNIQYVIGTPTCFAQQTKQVSVEMYVSSAISQAIPDMCNTNAPVNLTPFTASQGIWSGSGIVGSMFIPNTVGAGSFVLTHSTATSPSGLCPNSSTTSVRVYSLQTPTIAKVDTRCNNGMPIQLDVSPVGGIFGGINTNGVSVKGLFNPALGVIGKNIISYSINAGPCIAFAQTTINVEQFISADLATYPKDYYCIGADQPFNLNSLVKNPGGSWFGPGVVGNMFDPKKANVGINNIVYSTHSTPTYTLCPDSKTITVKTVEIPKINLSLDNNKGCAPLKVVFNSNEINGLGAWKFGDGTEDKSLYTMHTFTAPGTYTASFSYISLEGCSALTQSTSLIEVLDQPKPDFTMPREVYLSNPEIQTVNKTLNLGRHTYTWTVSDGTTGNPVNLLYIPNKIGRYEITLVVQSVEGCTAAITKIVDVKNEFNVYIPNSFTPANQDGLNDYFKPVFSDYGLNQSCYKMEIYDRWGQWLFSTNEVNKGWDGKVKGEFAKEGAYVYKIRYCSLDGIVNEKMGSVLLLRN